MKKVILSLKATSVVFAGLCLILPYNIKLVPLLILGGTCYVVASTLEYKYDE